MKIHAKMIVLFFLKLLLVMGVLFVVHVKIGDYLKKETFENAIILSYSLNLVIGVTSFIMLVLSHKKYGENLGHLFLLGSLFKFVLFYVIFKPMYSADGEVQFNEFLTLMVPYAVALTIEIHSLAAFLKD